MSKKPSEIPAMWTWPGCKGEAPKHSCSEHLSFSNFQHPSSLSLPMTAPNVSFRQLPLLYICSMVYPWAGSTKMQG